MEFNLTDLTVAQLTIAASNTSDDYSMHRKKQPWRRWSEYFGSEATPSSIGVIAQIVREKWAMVSADDDQSDLYKGRCTRALASCCFWANTHHSNYGG